MLIGTEAGLGARNAGSIAGGVGELVVTAAGRLENRGTLEAQRIQLASAGDIDNRGGTLRQTGSAALTLTAPALSNTAGGVIGAEPIPQAPSQPGSPGTTDASPAPSPSTPSTGTGTGTAAPGTTPSQPQPQPPAPGAITAAGAILNDGGRIHAGGPIAIQAPQINNAGGTLATASLNVSGPAFSNAGGTLNIANAFTAQVDHFDNTAGTLHAGSLNITATGELINQDGVLPSNGDATG